MQSDTEAGLSPSDSQDLRRLAGMLIPAGEEYGVPGADDTIIFADIMRSLGRDTRDVRLALTELATLAGGAFAELDTTQAERVAETFHTARGPAMATLARVILQCYYRDDRVLRSLGMDPTPPFPRGHTLEQGDWTLLDAVRDRPKLWRDDREI